MTQDHLQSTHLGVRYVFLFSLCIVLFITSASATVLKEDLYVSADTKAQGNSQSNGDEETIYADSSTNFNAQAGNSNQVSKTENSSVFFSINRMPNIHLQQNLIIEIENNTSNESEKVRVSLSNGNKVQIRIMPETASQTALAHLRLTVCREENNCTIVLKETGNGNETHAVYEVKARKKVRFLGIFNTRLNVSADVDAQTGKVVRTYRPWWAFLTTNAEASASA